MKEIVYPMTTDYIKDWGIWEAYRELLQNAMDDSSHEVSYTDGILTIRNPSSLVGEDLLFGVSRKHDGSDRQIRGKFGEGLKLALLVLTREGIEVDVRSGSLSIHPSLVDQFGHQCLKVEIQEREDDDGKSFVDGTWVRIHSEAWLLWKERYLVDSTPRILEDPLLASPPGHGHVYVGGLWVSTMSLKYSYNFSPDQVHLNRDRDIPSMTDIQWGAAKLISMKQEGGVAELLDMAITGASEVSDTSLRYNVNRDELVKAWTDRYGDQPPLCASEQEKKKGIIVVDWLAKLLNHLHLFFAPDRPIDGWIKKWESYLPNKAIEELKGLIDE